MHSIEHEFSSEVATRNIVEIKNFSFAEVDVTKVSNCHHVSLFFSLNVTKIPKCYRKILFSV